MRNFPTEKALVVAYWRKLASRVEAAYKSRGRASARRAAHVLQTREDGRRIKLNH
jgi:hypothetical protein